MNSYTPRQLIKLFIVYLENEIIQIGLNDITIEGIDTNNNIILLQTNMIEERPGNYVYYWNTSSILPDTFVNIIYKRNTNILDIEQFYFELTGEEDGQAF